MQVVLGPPLCVYVYACMGGQGVHDARVGDEMFTLVQHSAISMHFRACAANLGCLCSLMRKEALCLPSFLQGMPMFAHKLDVQVQEGLTGA